MENRQERIRELTPREYWRLMGFTDEDFDKASKVSSETQLYAQAGNSICVPVLECIFREMFSPSKKSKKQPMLESFNHIVESPISVALQENTSRRN